MSIEQTDAESAAVAKKPDARVSLADIKAAILHEHYFVGSELPGLPPETKAMLGHLTVCILVMRNGFIIIGKSAPVDPENYNQELGVKFAYEDAVRHAWPLCAFSRLGKL